MIMSLTVLSSTTNDKVEFSYTDGDVFIKYKNDELEGYVDLFISEVISLKAWCEQVIDQESHR